MKPDHLVELARYPTSTEAAIVRNLLEANGILAVIDGEATASWFGHMGSNIGCVRVRVCEDDAERAWELLEAQSEERDPEGIEFLGTATDIPGPDGAAVAAGALAKPVDREEDEAEEVPAELIRAWRASLMSFVLFPVLMNFYSLWVLFRSGYLEGPACNWRVNATLLVNGIVIALACIFLYQFVTPP